jgi:hypothetical protein
VSDTSTLGVVLSFAGVCVVNGAAVGIVWIQGKTRSDRTDAKIDAVGVGVNTAATNADTAATEAATAAKRVEPVSNGFAGKVLDSLEVLEAGQKRTEAKLDRHIGDHASADVRRRGGW